MHVKLRKGEFKGYNSCPLSSARSVKKNLEFDSLIFTASIGKLLFPRVKDTKNEIFP